MRIESFDTFFRLTPVCGSEPEHAVLRVRGDEHGICGRLVLTMESHYRNRVWLLPYQPLSSCLGRHHRFLQLDLLLEHVFDVLDVVDVIPIDVQVLITCAVAFGINLADQLPLVLKPLPLAFLL